MVLAFSFYFFLLCYPFCIGLASSKPRRYMHSSRRMCVERPTTAYGKRLQLQAKPERLPPILIGTIKRWTLFPYFHFFFTGNFDEIYLHYMFLIFFFLPTWFLVYVLRSLVSLVNVFLLKNVSFTNLLYRSFITLSGNIYYPSNLK